MRLGLGIGLNRLRKAAGGGGGDTIPVITGVPTISGTATVGNTLTASPASVSGTPTPTRTWQWAREGVDIGGATSITYLLVSADYGTTITVRQIETNVAGSDDATSAGTAIAVFSPADLFTGTDEGFWAPVTASRLWQDTARTTPVTASGDPVASWELTTRTGVIYATQAVAGARPTYNIDANGRERLVFDGTTDVMATSTITPASDAVQVFLTHEIFTSATRVLVEMANTSDANSGVFMLFQVGTNTQFRSKGTVSGDSVAATVLGQQVTTGLSQISTDSNVMRRDGVQVATQTSDQGTGNFLAHPIFIGARGNGSLFSNGAFYGLIVRFGAPLSGTQISDAEAWMDDLRNP